MELIHFRFVAREVTESVGDYTTPDRQAEFVFLFHDHGEHIHGNSAQALAVAALLHVLSGARDLCHPSSPYTSSVSFGERDEEGLERLRSSPRKAMTRCKLAGGG